jgi:hypothetical protein
LNRPASFFIWSTSAIFNCDFIKLVVIQAPFGGAGRLKMTVRFFVRCVACAALLLSAQVASAQQQPPAQILSQSELVNGGKAMQDTVQNLMTADRNNLAAIIAFAKTANEDQRKAIGTALANFAKALLAAGGDPTTIQQAVVAAGLPELSKAYADAGGDTGTAAAGAGGGGGGGGPTQVGPPTGGANSGGTVGGSNFAANQASNLTNGGTGGGGCSNCSQSPF